MRKIAVALVAICLMVSACDRETQFFRLDKHSGQGKYDRGEDASKVFHYQAALVSNIPKNQGQATAMLFEFHKKSIESVFSSREVTDFSTTFYQKNRTTSYFIENADDPGGFSSEILRDYFEKYGVAEIRSNRKSNSKIIQHEIVFTNGDNQAIPLI